MWCSDRINGCLVELGDEQGNIVYTSDIFDGAQAVYTFPEGASSELPGQRFNAGLPRYIKLRRADERSEHINIALAEVGVAMSVVTLRRLPAQVRQRDAVRALMSAWFVISNTGSTGLVGRLALARVRHSHPNRGALNSGGHRRLAVLWAGIQRR